MALCSGPPACLRTIQQHVMDGILLCQRLNARQLVRLVWKLDCGAYVGVLARRGHPGRHAQFHVDALAHRRSYGGQEQRHGK